MLLWRRMAARSRLEFASLELRADPEVVHAALAHICIALKFASEEPRAVPEVVPAAAAQIGCALDFATTAGPLDTSPALGP